MLRLPHNLSDGQLGLMVVVILPILGGLFWLYNAYRMGRLKWKPKGPANPRLVTLGVFGIIVSSVAILILSEHAGTTPAEEINQWDCSVSCAAESSADSYVITYSDAEIISNTGTLSFQNRNDFDIVVHLLAAGEAERKIDIPAGGVSILHQVKSNLTYTVGCHADVAENTEIVVMAYDGERADTYS